MLNEIEVSVNRWSRAQVIVIRPCFDYKGILSFPLLQESSFMFHTFQIIRNVWLKGLLELSLTNREYQ